MTRRSFLKKSLVGGAALSIPYISFGRAKDDLTKLTILHTNDVHSHIDQIQHFNGNTQPVGGAAARAALIKRIRSEEQHVLLLDAGDIFQGTPYFNLYKGDLEIELMNRMEYDAVTIGNHDFDAGLANLSAHVKRSSFDFLSANYSFSEFDLNDTIKPFKIFKKGRIRIGVFGLGIELEGLVPSQLYGNTIYRDPVEVALEVEDHLKYDLKCDYIICLSHLGFEYKSEKISDKIVARRTKFIDLVIGGHTHTFLDVPIEEENILGKKVIINQVGWAGIILGRLDIFFLKKMKKNWASGNTVIDTKKSIQV